MGMTFANRVCLITGGSSGIGLAIAESLAREGARLCLLARDPDALEQAAKRLRAMGAARVDLLSVDVADPAQRDRLTQHLQATGEVPELLVNAAGVVSAGLLGEVPAEEWQRLLDINVRGLVGVLDIVVPHMQAHVEAGGAPGHIVNVASMAGLAGVPGMSAYCASKFAVVGLTEGLRSELAAYGIGVTTVCPGFVQTPIASKVTLFGRMDNPRTRRQIESLFRRGGLTAEKVARATLRAVRRNQGLCVIGKEARMGVLARRFAPFLLDRAMARMGRQAVGRTAGRGPAGASA